MLYVWDESQITNVPVTQQLVPFRLSSGSGMTMYFSTNYTFSNNLFTLISPDQRYIEYDKGDQYISGYSSEKVTPSTFLYQNISIDVRRSGESADFYVQSGNKIIVGIGKGQFIQKVYSANLNTYPKNGQQGQYWYDNRTQINTPSQPGNLVVPQMLPNSTVQVTWGASTATVGNVVSYTLERSVDGNAWTSVYTGTDLSYTDATGDWATVAYRVYATDNYGSTSDINTSETQVVQDGLIYVTFTTPEGEKTAPFNLEFQLGVSGETTAVSDINCVGYLDGKEIYNSTLATGTTAQIPIDTTELGSGAHNINISAYKDQLIGANQFWSFSIAAIPFPEGGYGLQLQDYEGNDLLPITLSSLVKGINGKTVAENLQEMAASAGLSLIEGSYTGTGAFGSATPNTLVLTIEPQIVFISDSSGIGGLILPLINGNTQGLAISASGAVTSYPLVVSWTGNNVSWYNTSNAAAQLNTSGHVYSYRVIG